MRSLRKDSICAEKDCSAIEKNPLHSFKNVSEAKKELRALFREKRKALSETEKKRFSENLCQNILSLSEFKQANAILSFYPLENETDIHAVNKEALRLGKLLAFPRCVKGTREMDFYSVSSLDDLEKGSFSIYEPKKECSAFVPSEKVKTLCVVPAMSYDRNGFRIGYGGGFYDRYFSKLKELTMREDKCLLAVGAVYHTFLEQELPHDELDVAVDIVVTDKEFIFLA